MARSPVFSVVIPTRDRAALLERSLSSLAAQTVGPERFEVIVVDDGSVDATRDVPAGLSDRLDLRYVVNDGSGTSSAKNLGLRLAVGDLVLFFDDDDVASPTLLAEHERLHRLHANESVAVLGYTTWEPSLDVTPVMDYIMDGGQVLFSYGYLVDGQHLDFRFFWSGRTSAKRSFLAAHGSFRPELTAVEDVELGYRLASHGLDVVHCRSAASYMARPVTYDEFCARCEVQGRGRGTFSLLYTDPVVQAYCEVDGADERWTAARAGLLDEVERVHRLEAQVTGMRDGPEREVLVTELGGLYQSTFQAFKDKGITAARAQARPQASGRP